MLLKIILSRLREKKVNVPSPTKMPKTENQFSIKAEKIV